MNRKEMARELGKTLGKLLENGYEPPLYMALITINGYVIVAQYDKSYTGNELQFIPLAENSDPAGFVTPINIMFVDARGKAARVIFERSGQTQLVT